MTSGTYVSPREHRINLVVDALRGGPDAAPDTAASEVMSEDTARRLAVRVLQALDYIPETVR